MTLRDTDDLFVATYDELRALAAQWLEHGGRTPTLQPTAIVNEAFLKLSHREDLEFESRERFLSFAAKAMRSLVVDYARGRLTDKRGGGRYQLELTAAAAAVEDPPIVDLITLHEALEELERLHPRQCTIAELRFLSGMTIDEVAEVLDISPMTVKNDWRMARAWLLTRLGAPGG